MALWLEFPLKQTTGTFEEKTSTPPFENNYYQRCRDSFSDDLWVWDSMISQFHVATAVFRYTPMHVLHTNAWFGTLTDVKCPVGVNRKQNQAVSPKFEYEIISFHSVWRVLLIPLIKKGISVCMCVPVRFAFLDNRISPIYFTYGRCLLGSQGSAVSSLKWFGWADSWYLAKMYFSHVSQYVFNGVLRMLLSSGSTDCAFTTVLNYLLHGPAQSEAQLISSLLNPTANIPAWCNIKKQTKKTL